jgi:hypothetical protein
MKREGVNMHENIGNIGDVLNAAIEKKMSTSDTARLVGYKLPIKPGKITFSGVDPLGDGSRRLFKTSLIWGQSSERGECLPDKLMEVAQVTTMKFLPFKIAYDGTISGGGFFPSQPKKLQCNKCRKEIQVSSRKYSIIKRDKKNYCQDCLNKKISKNVCFLRCIGEIPGRPDTDTVEEMCKQQYGGSTNPLKLIPAVYGVFKKGEAPAPLDREWLEEEMELVNRYETIGREIRPLRFLSDLYTESSTHGKRYWKPIPKIEDLVVSGSPIVTQWVSDKEIKFCPFSKGGKFRAGYMCKLPKPSIDLLV